RREKGPSKEFRWRQLERKRSTVAAGAGRTLLPHPSRWASVAILEQRFVDRKTYQNCAGVKNVLRLETGKNLRIFDIRFCGTNSMSPGWSWRSSSKFREASIVLTLRTCASTTPSLIFLNTTTCECFDWSVKPPAMATASATVVGERSSYLPGCPTCPAATKNGRSKSFSMMLTSGSRRVGA